MFRIGQGCDFHRFSAGRDLILGGEKIPFSKGLDGHSDADVLTHAMADAVIGALAAGDIGTWFPPDDPKYKNAGSLQLLHFILTSDTAAGWKIVNLDSTVVCEVPHLQSYIQQMRLNITEALEISESVVSIKATTSERMGFTGRGEGIAAFAVVLLEQ